MEAEIAWGVAALLIMIVLILGLMRLVIFLRRRP